MHWVVGSKNAPAEHRLGTANLQVFAWKCNVCFSGCVTVVVAIIIIHHHQGRKPVNVRTGSGAHVTVGKYKKGTIGLTSRDIATSTIFTGCSIIHSVHCACNHLYTPLCAYVCVYK